MHAGRFAGLLVVFVLGCGHEQPRVIPRPLPDQPGCFRFSASPYTPGRRWGADDIFIDVPELVELLDEPARKPLIRADARAVRPIGRRPDPEVSRGLWWPTEQGLWLQWTNGFSGVDI